MSTAAVPGAAFLGDARAADAALARFTGNYLRDDEGRPWDAESFPGIPWYLANRAGGEVVDRVLAGSKGLTRLEVLDYLRSHEVLADGSMHFHHVDHLNAATAADPLLWLIVHMNQVLEKSDYNLSDLSLQMLRDYYLLRWPTKVIRKALGDAAPCAKTAYFAPREAGKTTLGADLLPMWAFCSQHVLFVGVATDVVAKAAEQFRAWTGLKGQFTANQSLRAAHPWVRHKRLDGAIYTFGGRRGEPTGWIKVMPVDGAWRGTKGDDGTRPDLVIVDDCDARTVSVPRRLKNLAQSIGFLGRAARIVLLGTTTTRGNVAHQLLYETFGDGEKPAWTWDWRTVYIPPLVTRPDGTRRSYWPGHVPAEGPGGLFEQEKAGLGTPTWDNEMLNHPRSGTDLHYTRDCLRPAPEGWRPLIWMLHVDPATQVSEESDYTAVVLSAKGVDGTVRIAYSAKRRVVAAARFQWLLEVYEAQKALGRGASMLFWEANNGGEAALLAELAGFPIPTLLFKQKGFVKTEDGTERITKEDRIAQAAVHCRMRRVWVDEDVECKGSLLAFNAVPAGKDGSGLEHDDDCDAFASAVLMELDPDYLGVPRPPSSSGGGRIGSIR